MLDVFWKFVKESSENRAVIFGFVTCPIMFVFFGWFDPSMNINKHAFSGCMTEPNAVSAYMDSVGFWVARAFRTIGLSLMSSIVFGVVYYVLEMVPNIVIDLFKIGRCVTIWSYDVCVAIAAPKEKKASNGFHLNKEDSLYEDWYSIGWFRASVESAACMLLRLVSTRWAVTLINVVLAVAMCVAWMVLSAPRVCYASAPNAYIVCVGLFITLFCVLAPLEIVSTILFWNKAEWLRSFASKYMRSVMYRMNTHSSSFTAGDMCFNLVYVGEDQAYFNFKIDGAGGAVSKILLWKTHARRSGYAVVSPHPAEPHYYAVRKPKRITFDDLVCIVEDHKLRALSAVNELKQVETEEAAE